MLDRLETCLLARTSNVVDKAPLSWTLTDFLSTEVSALGHGQGEAMLQCLYLSQVEHISVDVFAIYWTI